MRTAGNKAFTLVELLMVIMIISILSTLVVPAVMRAVALARQSACRSNIRGIIQGLKGYSSVSEEMPTVPVGTRSWDVAIGTNWTSPPFRVPGGPEVTDKDRNHSANLWLLVRDEHAPPPGFVCPGTNDVQSERQNIKTTWDFASSEQISYGLQSPYGFDGSLSVLTPSSVVLVADGSPYVEQSTGDNPGRIKSPADLHIVDWGADSGGGEGDDSVNDEAMLYGNSPNHNRDGQNVGYIDGKVEWRTGANCGKNGDNIYTATGKDASDEETSTSPGGKLTSSIQNNENDTLILP